MMLGMHPALISTVVSVQRIWDAVTDPVVGRYSDNFRSRWGRRRPLIGAVTTFLLMSRYELTEDRVYEIKAELAERRRVRSAAAIGVGG